MDIPTVLTTATIAGTVNLVLGGVLGGLVNSWLKKRDTDFSKLQNQVDILREEKVNKIETFMAEHASHESSARKDIYEQLDHIRTRFVHKEECQRMHETLTEQYAGVQTATLKLERVGERTDMALKRGEDLLQELIGVKEDVARLCARMEALRDGQD